MKRKINRQRERRERERERERESQEIRKKGEEREKS